MTRRLRGLAVVLLAGLLPATLAAQALEREDRPRMRAGRVETPPALDGEVLKDPAWRAVSPANGFRQTAPDEGKPASEKTDVYVAFTADTLYLGFVCWDRDPEGIIVADSRRDSSLAETDSVQVILDTYLDGQTGFVFGTNPAGIEYDGQVTREGEGSFGSAGGFNLNWDAAWEVRTSISDFGWSAEIAIPFRSLRFPREEIQTWGINFQRNIRRRNETAYWAPLPRQYDLYRLSLAGRLDEIEPPRRRNLQLTPYALAEGRREGLEDATDEQSQEVGLDLKYGVTPSLTLDATYNTDFAQVEADELQINLDRFNLFFPEKRPFFLENAGYFAVGVPEEVELFFSRRIGIGPEGEVIPIAGGLRLSGKAQRYNLGFLAMRADQVTGIAPTEDFLVARASRDLPNRSAIGVIAISREGRGREADEDDSNRTWGVDGRWGIGRNGLVQGFVARTETPGATGDQHAFRLGGSWDSEKWSFAANYAEVADDFNPEVGFLSRRGYRKPDFFALRRIRPESLWGLHELRPHVSYRGYWSFDGFQETGFLHVDNHWEWKNGYELHTGINFTREGVTEAFEIFPGVIVPAGTYEHQEAQIVFFTNQGAPASFELRLVAGGFFGGDRVALTPELRFRIGERFNTALGWSSNDIDLPGGAFTTNLGRLRASYSFTPRIFVQALVQYNDRDDLWATNLRFAWLRAANTGFYLVYNETRDIDGAGTGIPGRAVILKYSHLLDLFD